MAMVESIEDLLIQILVRVPARSLVRFKCVSKRWLSLISDPEFCHRHTLRNPRSSVSAVFPARLPSKSTAALSFIPLNQDYPTSSNHANQNIVIGLSPNCNNPLELFQNHLLEPLRILQSCNGLFLCGPRNKRRASLRFYVLNPTTNQFRRLISPAVVSGGLTMVRHQALAFDPSRSPHYKLLVFSKDLCCQRNLTLHIYSSETNCWRLGRFEPHDYFTGRIIRSFEGGIYCNGAVHWEGCYNQIVYYHIDDERAGHVPVPRQSEKSKFSFLQQSHCGSYLHLIHIYSSRIEVSELKRDYSGWCLKYNIDLDHIFVNLSPRNVKDFVVLFLTPDESDGGESSSLLLHIPGHVISYNLTTKISECFRLTPRQDIDDSKRRVAEINFGYMQTLACV